MTEQLNNNNRNEFLSIESFVNTKINGLSKVQCLVNTVNKSKVPNQPVTVFAWSSKKHEVLCYPDGKLHTFCWLIPDALSSTAAAFSWSHREQYLLELIIWFSGKNSWKDSLPIPSYKQHNLLRMKTSLWYGRWWLILLVPQFLLLHIIVQYSLFITHHKTFSLNVSREMHVEIQSSRLFH